jgi:mitochondrial fission protein ELM1
VLISIGRHSVPLALAVKKLSCGRTLALHIQNPKVNPARFDIVAAPIHDALKGANVVTTLGAAHRVTPERLSKAADTLAPKLSHLPHPRVAVLIGGASKAFRFESADAQRLGEDLARLARKTNASLLVTPSRRTGAENVAIIARCLDGVPAEIWDGKGDNPYFAFLGLAEAIVATSDSVNMVTEAAGTGKPVYVYPLRGRSARLARFHAAMRQRGATRTFDGRLDSWSYVPVNDTEIIAAALRRALAADKGGGGAGLVSM